jgi:hypothetical protein
MDTSGLVIFPLFCLFGLAIPLIITGTLYGLITLRRKKTDNQVAKEKTITILAIIFVVSFTFSCATFLLLTKDFVIM